MAPKRVLVIDDEEDMREVVQVSLEIMAGLEVIVAGSSREGLVKAEATQPDAILLDWMMPEMDGPAVCRQLQVNPKTQNIPIILLTAKTLSSEQDNLTQLGVKAAIAKPFKPAKLAAQLLSALGWS
ncbi:MAG: response regulator [Leptolyngbyaceae cyanobacterium MO_188.B28]|nr:response regulator [Leptolyngbyaceae cyanobacterium MO_188.B28]